MPDYPGFDTSTPASGKAVPSPFGAINSMGQLMQMNYTAGQKIPISQQELETKQLELKDNLDTRAALKATTKIDPMSGQPVPDYASGIQELMKSNPRAGLALTKEVAETKQKQIDAEKAQIAKVQEQTTLMGALAGSALQGDSQESYDRMRSKAAEMGLPVDDLPKEWNETTKKQAVDLVNQGVTAHDQIQWKLEQAKYNRSVLAQDREALARINDQYENDEQTKEFTRLNTAARQISTAYHEVKELAAGNASGKEQGAADMALVTGMIKMENPQISPTQGSMLSLEDARSLPADVVAAYNKVTAGGTLDNGQREAIKRLAERRWEDSKISQAVTDGRYQGQAIAQGIPTTGTTLDARNVYSYRAINPFAPGNYTEGKAFGNKTAPVAPKATPATPAEETPKQPTPEAPQAAPQLQATPEGALQALRRKGVLK